MPGTESAHLEVAPVLARLMDREVIAIDRIGGGRNSRVYRFGCADLQQYVAKMYFRDDGDDRDRLGVEFGSLQFLWDHGVRNVPEPVGADRQHGFAVYRFVEGERIRSEDVTAVDVDDAVNFVAALKELRIGSGSRELSAASEAATSIRAVVLTIEARLAVLSSVRGGAGSAALQHFLADQFKPAFDAISAWCRAQASRLRVAFDADLEPAAQTLSPSDFGFHNAVRSTSGRIVYLDFEYFGWDDPAKLMCDFVLHPAMALSEPLKRRFVGSVLARFADIPQLAERLRIVYPLFALKWCLILLNEFVPDSLRRRRFVDEDAAAVDALRAEQLSKARRMLAAVAGNHEHFPYGA